MPNRQHNIRYNTHKNAETKTCQKKHNMFDRCKTLNVLQMANKKCANKMFNRW